VPQIEYHEKMTVRLGERTFELLHLKNVHSEAETAVWLPTERVLFATSVAIPNSINNIRPFVAIPDMLAGTPAWGEDFVVNSTVDAVDISPGDGVCAALVDRVGPACTLRAAIQEANTLAGIDTIIVPEGTYTLTIGGAGEDLVATGDLDIRDGVNLLGAGPRQFGR